MDPSPTVPISQLILDKEAKDAALVSAQAALEKATTDETTSDTLVVSALKGLPQPVTRSMSANNGPAFYRTYSVDTKGNVVTEDTLSFETPVPAPAA